MSATEWIEAGFILLLFHTVGRERRKARKAQAQLDRIASQGSVFLAHTIAAVASLAVACAECHTSLTQIEADEATAERVIRRRAGREPTPTLCRRCLNAQTLRAEHERPQQ